MEVNPPTLLDLVVFIFAQIVSQWECPGCTSLNSDMVNDCVVCGTYCRGKRNSKRL